MKNRNLRLSILLGLLIYLFVPTHAVAKPLKGNVIFVRGGIVIELEERLQTSNEPDALHPLPSLVIREVSEPAEEIFPAWIDDQRALATYDWKPQTHYHIAFRWTDGNQFEINTTAPLKPLPYRIRIVELEEPLSLLANLQRPAKPTTIAFSPNGEQLAIGTDAGHLAVINPLTGIEAGKHVSPKATPNTQPSVQMASVSTSVSNPLMALSMPIISQRQSQRCYGDIAWRMISIPQYHRIQTMCMHGYSIRDPIGSRQRRRTICLWWEITRGRRMAWG